MCTTSFGICACNVMASGREVLSQVREIMQGIQVWTNACTSFSIFSNFILCPLYSLLRLFLNGSCCHSKLWLVSILKLVCLLAYPYIFFHSPFTANLNMRLCWTISGALSACSFYFRFCRTMAVADVCTKLFYSEHFLPHVTLLNRSRLTHVVSKSANTFLFPSLCSSVNCNRDRCIAHLCTFTSTYRGALGWSGKGAKT